jgi:hypothetical protein
MSKPLVQTPKYGALGAIIGRPRKDPPVNAKERIFTLAAEGRPIVGVALHLGTTRETLRRWMKENPELEEAFLMGKEEERHEYHQMVARDARDGAKPNVNAFFILQRRHGYRENDVSEQSSRINITFNMPAALSREDYLKKVVNEQSAGLSNAAAE